MMLISKKLILTELIKFFFFFLVSFIHYLLKAENIWLSQLNSEM